MLGQRRRQWPSIKTGQFSCAFCATSCLTLGLPQQTQNICITIIQRRPNVFAVGQTLYKCYTNALCLVRHTRQTRAIDTMLIREGGLEHCFYIFLNVLDLGDFLRKTGGGLKLKKKLSVVRLYVVNE